MPSHYETMRPFPVVSRCVCVAPDPTRRPGIVWRSAEWRGETAALTDAGRQDPTGKQREGAGTVSPQRKHHRLQRKWAGGQTRGSVCVRVRVLLEDDYASWSCMYVCMYCMSYDHTGRTVYGSNHAGEPHTARCGHVSQTDNMKEQEIQSTTMADGG